jgi:hypothetical protein
MFGLEISYIKRFGVKMPQTGFVEKSPWIFLSHLKIKIFKARNPRLQII